MQFSGAELLVLGTLINTHAFGSPMNIIDIFIDGKHLLTLVDTLAAVSVMDEPICRKL